MKKSATVLIIDGGGRGASLVYGYSKSNSVKKIIAVPGNDLMSLNSKKQVLTFPDVKTTDISQILAICRKERVDLVDVAQDNAVSVGLVNTLLEHGFSVVGPTKEAGEIEWNKAFAREFMTRHKLPVPFYKICKSEEEGHVFITSQKNSAWFVKAHGLLEGKGALPAKDNSEALEKIKEMKRFGKAGETYLLEEWLEGEEFSAFAVTDGIDFQIFGYAQDHKRSHNYDEGQNTGGMGCVSNPLIITPKIHKQVEHIFNKTIQGLKKENRTYKGILYLGAMCVKDKVYIIEFNARWGDPEAEVLIPGLSCDMYNLGIAIHNGTLGKIKVTQDKKTRIAVTCASKGYPVDYSHVKGKQIFGLDKLVKNNNILIFSAAVIKDRSGYFANGGRLFYIVAEGKNVLEAREKAYASASQIFIEGNNLHFRTDIGYRDVARLYKTS